MLPDSEIACVTSCFLSERPRRLFSLGKSFISNAGRDMLFYSIFGLCILRSQNPMARKFINNGTFRLAGTQSF